MKRRTRLPLITLLSLLGVSSLPAQENSGSNSKIKNILFIVSDDLKASVLPSYGDKICKTPQLDKLAASGIVFDGAYCQGVLCGPSRYSFMRGIYPYSKARAVTIGEHLRKSNIHTTRVGKIFHMPVPHAQLDGSHGHDVPACWDERYSTKSAETFSPGLYRLLNKGIVTREVKGRDARGPNRMFATVATDMADGSDQADHMVATKAIELLRERKQADKPFFLAIGFVRPHFPMVQPKRFFDMYPQENMPLPPVIDGDLDDIPQAGRSHVRADMKSEEARRRMWQAYYGSVSFVDEQLGRVVDELERLGLRESTAIIFFSDHGYHLGEHGFWQKNNIHEEVARIPMIISAPGIKPGRSSSMVELTDLAPTCYDFLGLPVPDHVQGKSLLPILNNPQASVRDTALTVHTRGGAAIRSADWHYLNYNGKGEELYDMSKDPHQYVNLIDNPDYAAILKKARQQYQERVSTGQLEWDTPIPFIQ